MMKALLLVTFTMMTALPMASAAAHMPIPTDLPGRLRFHAEYDQTNHTMTLAWTPVDNDTYTYQLYRNQNYIATVAGKAYNDTASSPIDAYQIVATSTTNQYQDSAYAANKNTICDPLGIGVYANYPFVAYQIRKECLPPGVNCPNICSLRHW